MQCTVVKGYGYVCDHELMLVTFLSHSSRSTGMSVALKRSFTLDSIKKDCTLFPGVTLNCLFFNGCVNLLQRVKDIVGREKQNRHVRECPFQEFLVFFFSKTHCCPEVSPRGQY